MFKNNILTKLNLKIMDLTRKDVFEIFKESFNIFNFSECDWDKILDETIDEATDETWFELISKYDDSLYNICYQFYLLNRIPPVYMHKRKFGIS